MRYVLRVCTFLWLKKTNVEMQLHTNRLLSHEHVRLMHHIMKKPRFVTNLRKKFVKKHFSLAWIFVTPDSHSSVFRHHAKTASLLRQLSYIHFLRNIPIRNEAKNCRLKYDFHFYVIFTTHFNRNIVKYIFSVGEQQYSNVCTHILRISARKTVKHLNLTKSLILCDRYTDKWPEKRIVNGD